MPIVKVGTGIAISARHHIANANSFSLCHFLNNIRQCVTGEPRLRLNIAPLRRGKRCVAQQIFRPSNIFWVHDCPERASGRAEPMKVDRKSESLLGAPSDHVVDGAIVHTA